MTLEAGDHRLLVRRALTSFQSTETKELAMNSTYLFAQLKENQCIIFYCIVSLSIHLYSASCSAHQSEALPVRERPREKRADFDKAQAAFVWYVL